MRDNAKARESGFEDDDDERKKKCDFVFSSSKARRSCLRRLGSQFRVNARREMDIEEEDALTFLCVRDDLLVYLFHYKDKRGGKVIERRSMETRNEWMVLGDE